MAVMAFFKRERKTKAPPLPSNKTHISSIEQLNNCRTYWVRCVSGQHVKTFFIFLTCCSDRLTQSKHGVVIDQSLSAEPNQVLTRLVVEAATRRQNKWPSLCDVAPLPFSPEGYQTAFTAEPAAASHDKPPSRSDLYLCYHDQDDLSHTGCLNCSFRFSVFSLHTTNAVKQRLSVSICKIHHAENTKTCKRY